MAETSASKLAKRIHTDGSTHYKGATAPANPVEGDLWYDTSTNALKGYDGSSFIKVSSAIPTLSSVTGTIYDGLTSDLTLAGSNFLAANLVVNFLQADDSIDVNVTVTPSSDTAATVTVPSSVFNSVTAGRVVTIKVTNSDGGVSATVNTTAVALPSGGTITTSGNYRIHTFTSSGNFVNTVSSLAVEYLVIAGGGAGGGTAGTYGGGGGGAGGYRTNVSGQTSGGNSSAEAALSLSAATFAVTVGAGGAYNNSGNGGTGGNSIFSTITSLGGAGGAGTAVAGLSGGSGSGTGGTAGPSAAGGSGTSGQGTDGGGNSGSSGTGGGGGGAGQAGFDDGGDSSTYGDGGNGLSNNITGSSVTRAGGGG